MKYSISPSLPTNSKNYFRIFFPLKNKNFNLYDKIHKCK